MRHLRPRKCQVQARRPGSCVGRQSAAVCMDASSEPHGRKVGDATAHLPSRGSTLSTRVKRASLCAPPITKILPPTATAAAQPRAPSAISGNGTHRSSCRTPRTWTHEPSFKHIINRLSFSDVYHIKRYNFEAESSVMSKEITICAMYGGCSWLVVMCKDMGVAQLPSSYAHCATSKRVLDDEPRVMLIHTWPRLWTGLSNANKL
jgi:hypothetical protein